MTELTKDHPVTKRFAEVHNISVDDVMELLELAERAKKAQERAHNNEGTIFGRRADERIAEFEKKAKTLGFGVVWPNLYPVLTSLGDHIHLPD